MKKWLKLFGRISLSILLILLVLAGCASSDTQLEPSLGEDERAPITVPTDPSEPTAAPTPSPEPSSASIVG